MASTSLSNDYQTAASALITTADRSHAEKLFDDAVRDARAEASNQHDKKLLSYLLSIHDETSLKESISRLTKNGHGAGVPSRAIRRLARLCEKCERPMELARRVAEANQTIAKPVVGVVAYIMTIVQEIKDIDSLMKEFHFQTTRNLEAFKAYFLRHSVATKPVTDALKHFYHVLLDFGVFSTHLCYQSTKSTVQRRVEEIRADEIELPLRLALGNPKLQLQEIVQRLENRARFVFEAAGGETYNRVIALENAISEPSVIPQASQPVVGSAYTSIPTLLSPHFTGRRSTLMDISQRLGDLQTPQPTHVALWGMPGVGKTQLTLRYKQYALDDPASPKYTSVLFVRANDPDTLVTDFRRIARGLGLVKDALVEERHETFVVEAVKQWLVNHEGWLLIFDNVKTANDLLRFCPSDGKGHIIYTTRSENTAVFLCKRDNALEVLPLSDSQGAEIVKSLMKYAPSAASQNPDIDAAAVELSKFAKGLPLTIEQTAQYAIFQRISVRKALEVIRKTEAFLRQQSLDSFHEDNLSTGAILITTFEAVAKRYPMAGSLYQTLSYLEPSSIPISMLLEGASEMDSYLARSDTYTRGAVRTPEGEAYHQQSMTPNPFRLDDYDPFKLEDWRRIGRVLKIKVTKKTSGIPRVDSIEDVEMQQFWQGNPKFRGLFNDKTQMEVSLNQLVDSGLVKRLGMDNLWIHDLFAELMTAYTTATESKKRAETRLHVTATLVWLAFPIPQQLRLRLLKTCYEYLPHALSCLGHFRTHGALLTVATVGAELSHVVASVIAIRNELGFDGNGRILDLSVKRSAWETALEHYLYATKGYMDAQKRLMSRLQGGEDDKWRVIKDKTIWEMQIEASSQDLGKPWRPYSPERYLQDYERFGSTATWRCAQMCGKLAWTYFRLEQYAEAEAWARRGKQEVESIWGTGLQHPEVLMMGRLLMDILLEKEDWQGALAVAHESRDRYYLWHSEPYDGGRGIDPRDVMHLPRMIGRCYVRLDKMREGIRWLSISLVELRQAFDEFALICWGIERELATALSQDGQYARSLDLCLHAIGFLSRRDTNEDGHEILPPSGIVDGIADLLDTMVAKYKAHVVGDDGGNLDPELQHKLDRAKDSIQLVRKNHANAQVIRDLEVDLQDPDHEDFRTQWLRTYSRRAHSAGFDHDYLGWGTKLEWRLDGLGKETMRED